VAIRPVASAALLRTDFAILIGLLGCSGFTSARQSPDHNERWFSAK
jgi:hypothetical protein